MNPPTSSYYRHRFPSEIISHCVWLYFRFSLSFRDVEEMMNERGVTVTYESVHNWCLKFGEAYAKRGSRYTPVVRNNSIRRSGTHLRHCGAVA